MSKTIKIKEDAPAMSAGTGGFSSSSPAPGPTAGYDPVMQFKSRVKKKIKKVLSRAKPPGQPGVMISDND